MRSWAGTRGVDDDDLTRRRTHDARVPVNFVFFRRDDHAATETECRGENDDDQHYPVHFLSFQICETSTMSCPHIKGRNLTVGNMMRTSLAA